MEVGPTISQALIWSLIVLLVAVGVYDMFALYRWGERSTVSYWLYLYASDYPIIAFAFGVLIGHLLWPQRRP